MFYKKKTTKCTHAKVGYCGKIMEKLLCDHTASNKCKDFKKKRKKKSPLEEAKDKAWKWFSTFIRLKYSDENGYVKCVTCGEYMFWKGGKAHAGHYVNSRCNAVLLEEKIVFVQCYTCNIILEGNKNKYTEYLKRIGYTDDELLLLENLKFAIVKRGIWEWEYCEELYKKLAKDEAKKRGLEI